MTPDLWRRAQEVFAAATERESGSRAAFLDEACRGDPELRNEVESLLSSLDAVPSAFLGSPAIEGVRALAPAVQAGPRVVGKGTRLGSYEILARLGAGGMGEVYRAKDGRLGREVAIKVLSAELSLDASRVKRFEKEARSASALNHPNIVTVYEFGSSDGLSYIAMEKVDGDTLRKLLAGGPVPIKKLLAIATQIADGLARAHEAGIVHRDLKPENVMVTKDGLVKILDFGLAKLSTTGSGSDEGSRLPTASGTTPGLIMGTAGYMSPEQATGAKVDFRSDQFSFGSILYEMVTGNRAFQGKTPIDVLGAILNGEPEPITELSPKAPTHLRWIVERCLAKEPRQRYSSTDDLARDLATIRDHLSEASGTPLAGRPSRRRRLAGVLVLAAALVAGAAVTGFLEWRSYGHTSPPLFRRLTFRRGHVPSARFGVDSKTVVYSAAWDGSRPELFSTRSDSSESRSLGLGPATLLAISTTGQMAIARAPQALEGVPFYRGTLAVAPLAGGAARDLLNDVLAADWDSSGKEVAVVRKEGDLYRLEFPPGRVLYESKGFISNLRISPKQNLIAFLDHPEAADDGGLVAVVDIHAKKTVLTRAWEMAVGLAWSPKGDEVWFTAAESGAALNLYAVSLNGRQRLIQRVGARLVLQDISQDGRVLLTEENLRRGIVGLSSTDAKERDLGWLDFSSLSGRLSADGTSILFSEQSEGFGPNYAACIRKMDGSPAVRLGEGLALSLSPDGKWVLAEHPNPRALFLLPTGAGQVRRLQPGGIEQVWGQWFPDGKHLLVRGNAPGRPERSYIQSADGGEPRPFMPEGVQSVVISQDGMEVVGSGPQEGIFSIYPVEGGMPRALPGMEKGDWPIQWSIDGQTLYVWAGVRDSPAEIYRLNVSTGQRTHWKKIVPADPAGILEISGIDISRDGAEIVYGYSRITSDLFVVDGLK